MTAPVVWILAFASVVLLIAGGFTIAVARFRGRVVAHRRRAAKLGAQLEGKPADPFGELWVIGDQLRKIQQRLGRAEEVAGLPVQSSASVVSGTTPQTGTPVTGELEQSLDLFKKEVYTKTHRIDELVAEKQVLAEKIVALESALAVVPAPSAPLRKPHAKESNMALVDVLQAEADELRSQIVERDRLLVSLEKSDTSGLIKEVGRIRMELMDRNEELSALRARQTASGQTLQLQTKLQALVTEKEELAARAAADAEQLRTAKRRIGELEQILVSPPGAASASPAPTAQPPQVAATRPGPPRVPSAGPPKVPPPMTSVPPRMPPPPGTQRVAPPPPSPGFPDEPTMKSGVPKMTPPPQSTERRRTGSIFPAPHSKKDLLD